MKKISAAVLAICILPVLYACGAEESAADKPAAEAVYTLGMGVVLNTDSSESGSIAQVDGTMAAVVMDAEGKIVSCRLDSVQNKMDITEGFVDTAAEFKSKMELGADYGMAAYGGADAEWDVQAKAFESFAEGRTAADIENMAVREKDGRMVSADEALYASCTIDISDFKAAVVKACTDPMAVSFSSSYAFTLGLAVISDASGSSEASTGRDGTVKMFSDFAAVAADAEGKILAALNDAVQPEIIIDPAGEIVESKYSGSKREQGDNYGMVAYGNAIAEWYDQAAAFSRFVTGMSSSEVRAIETSENEGSMVAADETLYASCTMDIGRMQAVTALAAEYAR